MTVLAWDQAGEHVYQTGIDRGALYLRDGTVVAWNGLTSVEETSNSEIKTFYLDGVKYLESVIPGDFAGTLKAFTYPDEFDRVMGIVDASAREGASPGLFYYDQPSQSFNLSYRTRIGNDLDPDDGYKIHLLYNLIANPQSVAFNTISDRPNPTEFSWVLGGMPEIIKGYRPTVHIAIDTRITYLPTVRAIEEILYGTDVNDPYFPSIVEVASYFGIVFGLKFIDNGDGTWLAMDPSGSYISILADDKFMIENADATYLTATTYEVSDTDVEGGEP